MSALEIKDAHAVLTPQHFTLSIKYMTHVRNPNLFAESFRNLHFFMKNIRNTRLHYLLTGCRLYTGLPEMVFPYQQAVP